MESTGKMRTRRAALITGGGVAMLALGACGEEDFPNDPRPPVAADLSAVIRDEGVTISPPREGAGQVTITFSNQTDRAHTITVEGEDVIERTAPIQPQDTARIKKTLRPGVYEVRAGSSRAVDIDEQIRPGILTIGPERRPSNDDLLQP